MWQLSHCNNWLVLGTNLPAEGDYVALPNGLNKVLCTSFWLWYITVEGGIVTLVQMPGRDC